MAGMAQYEAKQNPSFRRLAWICGVMGLLGGVNFAYSLWKLWDTYGLALIGFPGYNGPGHPPYVDWMFYGGLAVGGILSSLAVVFLLLAND